MPIPRKLWRRLAIVLFGLGTLGFCIQTWVVPALILRQLEARYGGRVSIRGWWLGGSSAGVWGLVFHEGRAAGSPVWATTQSAATDLSLGGLLRGRWFPSHIKLRSPRITIRLDRQGHVLTRIPFKSSSQAQSEGSGDLDVEDAQVRFQQEGRPELVLSHLHARLATGPSGGRLSAQANDAVWGVWQAEGQLDSALRTGRIELSTSNVAADPEKLARLPFVPADVWQNVIARGVIDVRITLASTLAQPIQLRTVVRLHETTLDLPALGLTAEGANGEVAFEEGVVRLENVSGRALDGRVTASGTLDFSRWPARFEVALNLESLDVAGAPQSWQLGDIGATGRLTGKARVRVGLSDKGTDLTGTTGDAVIEGGTVQGIPLKSLRLVSSRVASRSPAPPGKLDDQGAAAPNKVLRLPESISTEFEIDRVAMSLVQARAAALGMRLPAQVGGRLSMKARATIPLDTPNDLKRYDFRGRVALEGASIETVEFGRVWANLDLDDGVLDLSDLRCALASRAGGDPHVPEAELRARLRAELAPPGRIEVSIEGNRLPIGNLAAHALLGQDFFSGLVTLEARAQGSVDSLADPAAWTASGRADSTRVGYRGTTLESISTNFSLKSGRLELPDLAATLGGQPMRMGLGFDLSAPYVYSVQCDTTSWSLAKLLALFRGVAQPARVDGALSAHAEATGTLSPWSVQSRGAGKLLQFRAGSLVLGEIPFHWTSERDSLLASVVEARPFGGRLSSEVRLPLNGQGPITGSATFTGIDTSQLSASLPAGNLRLTGKADGQAAFVIPAGAESLEANMSFSASDLTVQEFPAETLHATLRATKGYLAYEALAETLGGKVKFAGEMPLAATEAPTSVANARLQTSEVALDPLWRSLSVTGPLAQLHGLFTVDANLRTSLSAFRLWAHGVAELHDLTWGVHYPMGELRGIIALTPTTWRIEPVTGELLGGTADGTLWGDFSTPRFQKLGFEMKVDRAVLSRVIAMLPALARNVSGFGTLRLTGRREDGLHANAELQVMRARVFGLPLSNLRIPADLTLAESTGTGSIHLRRWTAHLSGGQVHGNAQFLLGADRSFRAETYLNGVDLETLARIGSEGRQPSQGKISGRISLSGPNPALLNKLKGKVVLDLDDASLVELPVLRELDRFLGSARGGLFEDGDLTGTIANKRLNIDELTLEGRTVQMHCMGTIGFDGQVNLVVLVNTSQIISQSGQALLAVIPGLRAVLGRSELATARVSSFLSSRLLKFRITGTLRSPSVALDPSISLGDSAVGFFSRVLEVPSEGGR